MDQDPPPEPLRDFAPDPIKEPPPERGENHLAYVFVALVVMLLMWWTYR